ncbi:MAG: hypothetical protein AUK63_2410 [bacterium P3]|nr:MAG: hypothetical protein AUK63_2410 [bacterium P3]KWW28125.1 MAG: hypothetical protein F083_2894 [bacterium F083]
MKINIFLLLPLFFILSCGSQDNNSLAKEDMTLFDGCTLFFRGIDDIGYNLYALMVEDDTNQEWFFLNAWYKDTTDYRLLVTNSVEVDTTRVLAILSLANRCKIREIHPIKEHSLDVYLIGKEKSIPISLD